MIEKIRFNNRTYDLIKRDDRIDDENIFTIIVGKNGTGKSTMLSSIVSLLTINYHDKFYDNNELGFRSFASSELLYDILPTNIIAVSSSPFDKFPLTIKINDVNNYTYLGLRDISSMNFGLSYMSKIISSLIESLYNNPSHWSNLSEVLNYLGFKDEIAAKFQFNLTKSAIEDLLSESFNFKNFFRISKYSTRNINRRFFHDENDEIEFGKLDYLRSILLDIINKYEFKSNKIIHITINRNGVNIESNDTQLYSSQIIFLLNSGILKLRDVGLIKKDRGGVNSIKQSSSGEQSVILSILGIASRITHNSLICIDEPEICLHPEWQERYIQILIQTFSKFNNCHFIIATHSPQIISNLGERNCFIVSMEDAEINNAKLFINNSVDFQLANIFKSPGFKNEYLSRIAISIISKVGKYKKFDEEDINNFNIIKSQIKYLSDNDPIISLYRLIEDLKE